MAVRGVGVEWLHRWDGPRRSSDSGEGVIGTAEMIFLSL